MRSAANLSATTNTEAGAQTATQASFTTKTRFKSATDFGTTTKTQPGPNATTKTCTQASLKTPSQFSTTTKTQPQAFIDATAQLGRTVTEQTHSWRHQAGREPELVRHRLLQAGDRVAAAECQPRNRARSH
jgi:hypothetical protein